MPRLAVALSGGVDSAVAALLLREAGHEVVGFTLKVWDGSRCCSLSDVDDARRVAALLGVAFYVLDVREEFEAEVVGPFVEAYRLGRTPNPCVACNRRLKFGSLLGRARALGCDALATGHYARLDRGGRRLRKGVDPGKDQSYFLVPERPDGLERVLLPLGERTKDEVRALAAVRGLPVAAKPESQDACFVPDGDLRRFLAGRLGPGRPGEVVDEAGRVVGTHAGLAGVTVGQRRGLGLAAGSRRYALRLEADANRLVVGPREALLARGLEGRGAVWFAQSPVGRPCSVKIRSTAAEAPCTVEAEGERVRVRFDEPLFGVAPGQLAVFYRGEEVLGGAWIEAALGEVG